MSEEHRINGAKGGRPPGPANLRDAHPLFLWEEGERIQAIGWINVRRYTATGPVDSPRVWPASELLSDEDLYALFGGGSYELLGRNSLPNGQPGQVIRRRRLMLEGPPKPFSGETPQPQAAAAPAAGAMGSSAFDLLLAQMREDRHEARQREERRDAEMRAAEERREARELQRSQTTIQLVTGALGAFVPLVQAIITRPPPPAPAPPAPSGLETMVSTLLANKLGENPLENIKKVLEVAKELKPEAPVKTESLPELLQGFGEAAVGIAQLEHATKARIEAANSVAPSAPPTSEQPSNGQTLPAPPPHNALAEESAAAALDSARLPS